MDIKVEVVNFGGSDKVMLSLCDDWLDMDEARALYRQLDTLFGQQVPPEPGPGDVWGELIGQLPDGLLKAACEKRREQGIKRYGQPLRRDDGRDHLQDAIEKLLDAAVYLQARFGVSEDGGTYVAVPPRVRGLLDLAEALLEFSRVPKEMTP